MKRILVFALLLSFSTSLIYGQGNRKKEKKTKDHETYVSTLVNMDFLGKTKFEAAQVSGNQTYLHIDNNLVNIGFSYQKINPNNTYTEFVLSKFNFSLSEDVSSTEVAQVTAVEFGRKVSYFETTFRVEKGKYFSSKEDSNWQFGIAGGVSPLLHFNRIIPKTSDIFPANNSLLELNLQCIPSIGYQFSKNAFIELKYTPTLVNFKHQRTSVENPILTEKQRISSFNDANFGQSPLAFNLHFKYRIRKT